MSAVSTTDAAHSPTLPPRIEHACPDGDAFGQWLAFPALDQFPRGATRRDRRTLLAELRDGSVWLIRTALDFAWSAQARARAAQALEHAYGAPEPAPGALALSLGDELDVGLELSVPQVRLTAPELWGLRSYAVQFVTDLALGALGRGPGPVRGSELTAQVDAILQDLEHELSHAVHAFMGQLDPEILTLARAGDGIDWQVYNRVRGVERTTSERRRQFARTFALLAPTLLRNQPSAVFASKIWTAVDAGQTIVPVLAAAYGVKPVTVRYLSGKPIGAIGQRWATAPGALLSLLDAMPPEWRPASVEAWNSVNTLLDAMWGGGTRSVNPILIRAWLAEHRRRAKATTGQNFDPHQDAQDARQIDYFCSALVRCLRTRGELFAALHEGAADSRARDIVRDSLRDRHWRSLAATARQWHEALIVRRNDAQAGPRRQGLARLYPRFVPNPWPIHDVILHPLLTRADLAEEGRAMRNCVEDYADACASGSSFIVSVRDQATGERISTAEFGLVKHGMGPVHVLLYQHASPGNAPAPPRAIAAVEAFRAQGQEPALQAHWQAILRQLLRRQIADAADDGGRLARNADLEWAFHEVLKPLGLYDLLVQRLTAQVME